MAMVWSWAFGNETEADLESIGFDLSSFAFSGAGAAWTAESTSVDPLNAYTYSGAVAPRYSLGADTDGGNTSSEATLILPGAAYPGDGTGATAKGIFAFAYRATNASVFQRGPRLLEVLTTYSTNACYIRTTASSGAISLYLDNAFKGTSTPVDAGNWNYIALVFDMTTTTFSGSLYVNGALEASGTQGTFGTGGINLLRLRNTQYGSGGATSLFGQFITYDDPVADLADAVSPDNFVTRVVPTVNGSTTGLWTATGAASLALAVSPPIDNTTYAGIASPSPGDRFDVDAGSNLQTLLGINPSSIKGATVHSVSLATAGTAKIGIGEGGSELLAPADPIQTGDTYIAQSYPNNPNGSTQATGTIEITGAVSAAAGDNVTINGITLTTVSGARTPGSDDFSTSGTTTDIRDDLLAAINDPLNSFTEIVEGVSVTILGNPGITLTATANYSGTAGNSITLAESTGGARISVSGATLSSGTDSAWVGADQPILIYEIGTV